MSENVVIKKDRSVTVPASEQKIGIQYDHNVNVVTFDCPRYPDDDRSVDMSTMQIYINYMLPDKTLGSSLAENVKVDTNNPDTIHFDWTITREVTQVKGILQALVCVKKVNADGIELYHWNTDLISAFRVGEGMECLEPISSEYADVISQLLVNMGSVMEEFNALSADVTARTSDANLKQLVNTYLEENPIDVDNTLTVSGAAADAKVTGDRISELKGDLSQIYESAFDGELVADISWINGTIDGTGDSSTVGNTATINSDSPYNKTRRCAFYDLKSDMNVKFLNTCVFRYVKVDSSNTILDSQVNVTRDFVLKKGRYAIVFYINGVSDLTDYDISDYIDMYYDIPILGRVETAEQNIAVNRESIDNLNLTPISNRKHYTGFPTSEKKWGNYLASSVYNHVVFKVSGGEKITLKAGTLTSTFYGCLKSYSVPANGDSVDYSEESGFTNRKECAKNNTVTFEIPSDARYLFIICTYSNKDTTPVICKIDGLDYAKQFASNALVDLINSKLSTSVKWCAIGDSITEGYISCEEEPKYKLSKSDAWAYKLAEMTGWKLTNEGIGGTGFVRNNTSLEDAGWNVVKNIDFTQFDFVTIAYGVNDWKYNCTLGTFNDDIENPTTIYGAMRSTIETIIASNPLCKIFMISPVNCSVGGSENTNWGIGYSFSNNGTLEQIYEAEKEVAEYYGIEFIDMLHNSIINRKNIKTCLIDNVHPSADTHTVMAHEIGGRLRWK